MTDSTSQPPRRRILSGVQPSGKLHLGNYFGAIRQHIALQDEGAECFFFIADYHSMTTLTDAAQRRANTQDVALDYLALGLDPARVAFFRQSDVPEVCELTWIFATLTSMGLLERAVSYKEKVERGIEANVGLFTYPILMAADILIYRSHLVPVGEDQIQHLEITRDIAGRFNRVYGEIFPLPDYRIERAGAKVLGVDGQKMSKSYGNTIEIFAEGKSLRKTVMGIVTDSKSVEEPKDPPATVFALYQLFASPDECAEMVARYRAGNLGYGYAKEALYAKIEAYFAPARQRRKQLAADPDYVEGVLQAGADRARQEARRTLDLVRAATGFAARRP